MKQPDCISNNTIIASGFKSSAPGKFISRAAFAVALCAFVSSVPAVMAQTPTTINFGDIKSGSSPTRIVLTIANTTSDRILVRVSGDVTGQPFLCIAPANIAPGRSAEIGFEAVNGTYFTKTSYEGDATLEVVYGPDTKTPVVRTYNFKLEAVLLPD